MTTVTKDNFQQEVEKHEGLLVIDLYADWCGPCRMMSPIIDEIAQENTDIKVGKVNVDENQDLAMKYNVMSIPTIIIFKNGKVHKQFVGVTGKDSILLNI